MSISHTLQQAVADKTQMELAAREAKVNDTFNKVADSLPALLKSVSTAALLRVTPATGLAGFFRNAAANSNWLDERRNKKLQTWMHSTGLYGNTFTPEGLEKFSGYRRLREYCAQPQVDIGMDFFVTGDSFRLKIQPTRNFATSEVTVHRDDSTWDDDYGPSNAAPSPVYSIPEFLAQNAATLAPPQVAPKIAVMAPLKLKV